MTMVLVVEYKMAQKKKKVGYSMYVDGYSFQ